MGNREPNASPLPYPPHSIGLHIGIYPGRYSGLLGGAERKGISEVNEFACMFPLKSSNTPDRGFHLNRYKLPPPLTLSTHSLSKMVNARFCVARAYPHDSVRGKVGVMELTSTETVRWSLVLGDRRKCAEWAIPLIRLYQIK